MADRWTKKELNGFLEAAQSLKQYRRADLRNEINGAPLIGILYVDPLPNNHILQTMLKANTTFLIGRKGTGKSTIFQRVQHDLSNRPDYTSAYIDIKTIYELSRADSTIMAKIDVNSGALSRESLEKLRLYRAFLQTIIKQIHAQLKSRAERTWLERIKRYFSGTIDDLFEDLDALLDEIDKNRYSSITGIKTVSAHDKSGLSTEAGTEETAGISLGSKPELKASLSAKDSEKFSLDREQTYADILILEFNITTFLSRLKELLHRISIRHLYIFIDDFSELPEDAMKVVVDTLLAPLNNWSEELIKFKIAAYPGRIYYGAIDKTKIDEINLDFYKLYAAKNLATMEDKAIDFTRRLIESRLQYYCKCDANVFIDVKSDDIWRFFFYATMANPRNLGYILFYLHESHLIFGRPINLSALREAARRYYEEKIEFYFKLNKFLHEDFSERSSVLSLRELLESIIKKTRELRYHKSSEIVSGTRRQASPTSHFNIAPELESLLSTLELNFFLTKYSEMSDRDGRKVSVFALNFGLCQKLKIDFGKPLGTDYRHYFVDRIFDYTPILENYVKKNQEIICDHCHYIFGYDELASIQRYRMQCPECSVGTCQVINLSKKYEAILKSIDPGLLLPAVELGILQTLHAESSPMFASDIAANSDYSRQLVAARGKILDERGLVERIKNKDRRQYKLTTTAKEKYFTGSELDDLYY